MIDRFIIHSVTSHVNLNNSFVNRNTKLNLQISVFVWPDSEKTTEFIFSSNVPKANEQRKRLVFRPFYLNRNNWHIYGYLLRLNLNFVDSI